MDIWVSRVDGNKWTDQFSEKAVSYAFGEYRDRCVERIDFALLGMRGVDAGGFVTCIEFDRDHVYWQMGGAFDPFKKSISLVRGFEKMIEYCLEQYRIISMRVDNDNIAMIKLALGLGFRIVGVFAFKLRTLVELVLERKDG